MTQYTALHHIIAHEVMNNVFLENYMTQNHDSNRDNRDFSWIKVKEREFKVETLCNL